MPAAHVLMTTTVGPITLELDADNAPKTVENFYPTSPMAFTTAPFFTALSIIL